MDINSSNTFKKIALRTMATCPLNSDYLPDEMVSQRRIPKQDKEDAEIKWKQNDLLVTNFLPSAAKQVQNPGLHARQCLDVINRDALYQVVPDSLAKTNLMILHQKFDAIRAIYTRRFITQEERTTAIRLCEDLKDCFDEYFPFITVNSTMHLIMDHIPEYLKDPCGTGNLLDMSSSGLESSNKTERFLIHLR